MNSEVVPAIRKRNRPQPRIRERSSEREETTPEINEEEHAQLPVSELLELRKLRKARGGIDAAKLSKGDVKKKKRRREEGEQGGLKKGAGHEDDEDEEDQEAKTRRVVRANNFTQQTNALDVDKHMMAYIEENLQVRSRPREDSDEDKAAVDPQEALYDIADKWKFEKQKPTTDVGSVSNSASMLTAIPEVDLGMDARLKNIEDTEKAKRVKAEERNGKKRASNDEDHLVATRFYRPNLRPKSDADILRDAKLEAMGFPPQEGEPRRTNNDRPQTATDELVMERFKKRMRK